MVLSGPSGAGKSTLLKKLMKEYDSVFGFSVSRESAAFCQSMSLKHDRKVKRCLVCVSDTTRKPRPGEENGKGKAMMHTCLAAHI